MKLVLLRVSATLVLVALFYTAAWGQNRLEVTIVDRHDEVVENPTVKAKNDETGTSYEEFKKENGLLVLSLPAGDYTITASAKKLKNVRKVTVKDGELSRTKIRLIDKTLIYGPYLVNMFCGALILFLLDIWLRHKGVKDSSLIWLYGSLFTWFIIIAMSLLDVEWLQDMMPISPEYYKYLVSVGSSVFFVLTAFKLSRVRDWFSEPKKLRLCRVIVLLAVFIISAVSFALLILRDEYWGPRLDAAASMIAGGVLGAGLTYSYYKYGNRIFAWFTALTFIIFIWRQWYLAINRTPTSGFLAPFFLANTTLVIMLFITLGVAWGLSDASRLKTVGVTANVEVAAMFFDLRGSTQWANDAAEKNFHYVKFFIDDFREWAWREASTSAQGCPKLVKFLGDGFMYVWEIPNDAVPDNAKSVADLACDLSTKYSSWINEDKVKRKFPWGTPIALGVGIDVGHAIRLTFESGSDDYLGSPMNIAAKMQNLARPYGGVVIQEKMWNLLDDIRSKFPKKGKITLGDSDILVRATENVEL
jgi:class 3 adenylate cyclase